MMNTFTITQSLGMEVFETATATEGSGQPNCKPSRHRSKRLIKKLIKRFSERRDPAAFVMNGRMYIHPVLFRKLADELDRRMMGNTFGGGQ